jgi:hypothetical protein
MNIMDINYCIDLIHKTSNFKILCEILQKYFLNNNKNEQLLQTSNK